MKEKISIRNYKSEDELEWLDVHASVMVDSHAWWIVLHKKIIYENDVIDLVACDKNKIVGFILAELNSPMSKKNEAFVWDFGVQRKYRGKNIGRMLIDALHNNMNQKFGIKKSIWYSQEPDSIEYYRHIGMSEIGRHWQFSALPSDEIKSICRTDGFFCQGMRGTCDIDKLDDIRKKYKLMDDDDSLKPMVCVGFEYVK